MSIKTTHYTTREIAIAAIEQKISNIYDLNDEELADLLEEVLHNGFYNFTIVSEEELENYKEKHYPTLDSTWNSPSRNDAW
jgi:hypothetical protein